MDNCNCCGAELRTGEVGFCKSCRQNISEGQVQLPRPRRASSPGSRRKKVTAKAEDK